MKKRIYALVCTLVLLMSPTFESLAQGSEQVVINHEEQFTDGAGVSRNVVLACTISKSMDMASPLLALMTIDGKPRTVSIAQVEINQVALNVSGSNPTENLSLNFLFDNKNWKNAQLAGGNRMRGKLPDGVWVMDYKDQHLVGKINGGSTYATAGTDPISFSAISATNVLVTEVIKTMIEEDADISETSLSILGGLFGGPKVGGHIRCSKKKIEYVKCNAFCVADSEGECSCNCLGIPCCSECIKVKETTWEYSGGASVGG